MLEKQWEHIRDNGAATKSSSKPKTSFWERTRKLRQRVFECGEQPRVFSQITYLGLDGEMSLQMVRIPIFPKRIEL